MLLQRFDAERLVPSNGASSQIVFPGEASPGRDVHMAWGLIAPGETSHRHRHDDHELFVVVSGEGRIVVDGVTHALRADDSVHVPPLRGHHIVNTSATEMLRVLKFWWSEAATDVAMTAGTSETDAGDTASTRGYVLVTATPPTPNGDLHVGHLSGPYLAADIHTRYLRLRGVETHYLTGIDDNQSYVALKAERIGSTSVETADRFGRAMAATWEAAGIHPDHIGQPRQSKHHDALVQDMFERLFEQGHIVVRDTPAPFCTCCDTFVFEAYVSGGCPHCDAGSGGNACEVCGRPNDCADLRDVRCNRCGNAAEIRRYPRLYFPLAPHADFLKRYWSNVDMGPHLTSLCEKMLADGLPEIAISHRSDWGVPVPVPGYEDHRIYVWFEMAGGYLAATQELMQNHGRDWASVWKNPDVSIVQFFGFDNGYFHAVLFPALFHAYDAGILPPRTFVTNEFYRLDGLKFSTSRNHAIWGQELLASVPRDVARFYLAYSGPECSQTNFTYAELVAFVRAELQGHWHSWLQRVAEAVARDHAGRAPKPGLWNVRQVELQARLGRLANEVAVAYEAPTFSPRAVTRALCELVRIASQALDADAHWHGLPQREADLRTGIVLQLTAAKALAVLVAPIMPDFAEALLADLGCADILQQQAWRDATTLFPEGRAIGDLGRERFAAIPDALPPRAA
ncbi:class I tRNA ligase family protein [Lysobacter hankyongensis]|uniref:methionine--tRNA ligase n=1 Tax=Lysobacter hankyongensis TaxID=1176535 RepID=A0ABP9AJY9_9GAMM